MASIESNKVELKRSAAEVFEFLKDLNNLEQLMPEGRISNWTSTKEECAFQIKGLAKIGMKLSDLEPSSEIKIVSNGKNPFDFTLSFHIKETEEGSCQAWSVLEPDANPFMLTMIQAPLKNFFNMLAAKLQEIHQ